MSPQREEQLRDTAMRLRAKVRFLRTYSLEPRDELDAEVFGPRLLRAERAVHRIQLRLANAQLQAFPVFGAPTEPASVEPEAPQPESFGRLGDLVKEWAGG